jgi:LuxR family maltose regulon positive regulatory protein
LPNKALQVSLSEDPGADGSDDEDIDASPAEDFGGVPSAPPELVAAVLARDWARVGAIVDADWLALLVDYMPTVHWMYRLLPLEVVENHAMLKAGRDLVLLGLTTGKVPPVPGPINVAALGQSSAALQILGAATASITVLGLGGSYRAACALVDQAIAIAAEAGKSQGADLLESLPTFKLMWGIALQLGGDLPGSVNQLSSSYYGNCRLRHGDLARDAAGKAALSCAMRGECIEATSWLEREAALPEPEGWLSELAPVAGRVARAIVALESLDRVGAAAALDRVRALHFRDGHWPFVAVAFAHFGRIFGSPQEAVQQLRDSLATHQGAIGDGIAGPLLLCAELDLLLALGQGDRAVRLLAETEFSSPQLAVITARVSLLGGQAEEADVVAAEELSVDHTPRVRMELILIRVIARSRLGDERGSRVLLSEALELSHRYELLSPFAAVPRELLTEMSSELPALDPIVELLDRSSARQLYPDRLLLTELTPRELIVLRELSTRSTLAFISEKLFVSLATLKSQRNSLYRKLGAHSRSEALERAYERGLL